MNARITRKLFSVYPDLLDELKAAYKEFSRVDEKKSDLARPKAVSWDGVHSQNPISQAELLHALISDEMEAEKKAASLERLTELLRAQRDALPEPARTIVDLKYFRGYTWDCLESRLNMPKSTMDSLIERNLRDI